MTRSIGCPRCGRENDMLVSVVVRWLDQNKRVGQHSKSRGISFCVPCAMEIYEYLRRHLEKARREKVDRSQ